MDYLASVNVFWQLLPFEFMCLFIYLVIVVFLVTVDVFISDFILKYFFVDFVVISYYESIYTDYCYLYGRAKLQTLSFSNVAEVLVLLLSRTSGNRRRVNTCWARLLQIRLYPRSPRVLFVVDTRSRDGVDCCHAAVA